MSNQNSNYNYQALKLERDGNTAMAQLVEFLRNSKLSEACYAYKIRTKTEERLLEKMARKSREKPEYQLRDITDVVGIRLVALFKSDMIELLDGCLKAIGHKNGVSPNPFIQGLPDEVIYYRGNSAYDELTLSLQGVVRRICGNGFPIKEEASKEGYSSIHLVARLSSKGLEGLFGAGYQLPVEIQIRTVFEDAWGEIDHKFGYVNRTGKSAGTPIANPESVQAHLRVLKKFADGCTEYGEVIRREATRSDEPVAMRTKVLSVEKDDDLVIRLRALRVSVAHLDKYIQARELKDAALNINYADPHIFKAKCLQAAEAFRTIAEENAESLDDTLGDEGRKLIYYYARMNECFCVISVNDRPSIESALLTYLNLAKHYSQFPLLFMRIGQAYGKLGYHDAAVDSLENAQRMRDEVNGRKVTAADDSFDELPKIDDEHMGKVLPRLLGYYLWRQALDLKPEDWSGKGALYRRAYLVTSAGNADDAVDEGSSLRYHNNLLYYSLGFRHCQERTSLELEWSKEQVQSQIELSLEVFDRKINEIEKLAITQLDTVMLAYSVLNRADDAKKVAAIVKAKALQENQPKLEPQLALEFVRKAEMILTDKEGVFSA